MRYTTCAPRVGHLRPQSSDLVVPYFQAEARWEPGRAAAHERFDLVVLSRRHGDCGGGGLGRASASSWTTTVFLLHVNFQPLRTPGVRHQGPLATQGYRRNGGGGERRCGPRRRALCRGPGHRGPLPERDVGEQGVGRGSLPLRQQHRRVPGCARRDTKLGARGARRHLYTCSQDSIRRITEGGEELGLNRCRGGVCVGALDARAAVPRTAFARRGSTLTCSRWACPQPVLLGSIHMTGR